MKKVKHNFSLVSLLVVIAIIAILAAMLLPAINRARTRARVISNASRLKQIGDACIMYSQDNDANAWPTSGTLDSAKLGSKYISSETLSSLDGAAFILDGEIVADSAPTDTAIKDTSIDGFANILYADGHVVTTTNTGSSSSEEEESLLASIPSIDGGDDPNSDNYGKSPPYDGGDDIAALMNAKDQLFYQHPLINGAWDPETDGVGMTAQEIAQYNINLAEAKRLLNDNTYPGSVVQRYQWGINDWIGLGGDPAVAAASIATAGVGALAQVDDMRTSAGLTNDADYRAVLDANGYTAGMADYP